MGSRSCATDTGKEVSQQQVGSCDGKESWLCMPCLQTEGWANGLQRLPMTARTPFWQILKRRESAGQFDGLAGNQRWRETIERGQESSWHKHDGKDEDFPCAGNLNCGTGEKLPG